MLDLLVNSTFSRASNALKIFKEIERDPSACSAPELLGRGLSTSTGACSSSVMEGREPLEDVESLAANESL